MKRREFLQLASGAGVLCIAAPVGRGRVVTEGVADLVAMLTMQPRAERFLILIELKGGNDGLNTVIPYAESAYYRLRPCLAVPRAQVLRLDERVGMHPSLAPLWPLWRAGELAVVQGVGYATPNTSHFRSAQIWETATKRESYAHESWLDRAFAARAGTAVVAEEAAVDSASVDFGPSVFEEKGGAAPPHVLRFSLGGFDTHVNQRERHAALLGHLADTMCVLRGALSERGCWQTSLIMTVSEFGRTPGENPLGGTEHGGAAPHLVAGGAVRGGLYGRAPQLDQALRRDPFDPLPADIDFRRLYATVLRQWWGWAAPVNARVFGEPVVPFDVLRA